MNIDDGSILSVIRNGYCIGCGSCTYINETVFSVKMNKYGMYEATINKKGINKDIIIETSKICPFSDFALDEFEISKKNKFNKYDDKLGFYKNLYIGHVKSNKLRIKGSSGGLTTWFLSELLNKEYVDGIIHVKPCSNLENTKYLFKYSLSDSVDGVRNGSGSHYYPIEMSEILKFLKESRYNKYAFVGLPCFIKSIKLLSLYYPSIRSKIKYYIGLVCGHLKATTFSEFICMQCDINPIKILKIKYRYKFKNRKASQYGLNILYMKDGCLKKKIISNNSLFGMKWSYGFFKYPSCDFCDDIYSECADISFGDAWLPEYEDDFKGTNIIITRNKEVDEILQNASKSKDIEIKNLSKLDILKSQSGGIRHKRDGLQYRLYLYKKKLVWTPKKRYKASKKHISLLRRLLYRFRFYISTSSNKLYFNSLNRLFTIIYFKIHIIGWVFLYNIVIIIEEIISKIKRFLRK